MLQHVRVIAIQLCLPFQEGSCLAVEIVAFLDVLGDQVEVALSRLTATKLYLRGTFITIINHTSLQWLHQVHRYTQVYIGNIKIKASIILVRRIIALRDESPHSVVVPIDLPFCEFVDELVLGRGVHHAPPLFPQLAHLVEDRDVLVVVDQQPDRCHHHEGAGASHACAAVDDGDPIFLEGLEELVD